MKKTIMLLSLLGALFLGAACGQEVPFVTKAPVMPSSYAEGKELYALVETEEEAAELAALYEIELVSFQSGVATFHTEEDPPAVIARGTENDWPPLEVNSRREAITSIEKP